MLIILKDPAGITGREAFAFDFGLTLYQNIALRLDHGGDCEVKINGVPVDPLTDPRMYEAPCVLDRVTVARRPAGFDPITWAVIAVVASIAVTQALMPKVDMPGAGGASGNDSPNNRLTAQTNTARAYQAIPDVYGLRRVWPDLIQPSTIEYIDNTKYVTEWLCISRGIGTITDVQYAETPINDIPGASYEVFTPAGPNPYPEFNTTELSDVIETFASDDVNGQEISPAVAFVPISATGSFAASSGASTFTVTIPDGVALANLKSLAPSGLATVAFTYTPWDDPGIPGTPGPATFNQTCTVLSYSVASGNATFTFSSSAWVNSESGSSIAFSIDPDGSTFVSIGPFTLPVDCDRIRWNTVFLRGLKGSVSITAEWWRVDGSGVEISGTRQSQADTYSADTYDQCFHTTKVTPSAGNGRYRMQFTRTTPQIGAGGSDVAKIEEVYAVRHYDSKMLPGVSIIRLTTKATSEATGFSDRKFNLRFARRVRTLTGDDLSESRNFARAMAHVWTLAGNDIAGLDVAVLAGINAEFGEDSELLRFDCSLDDADMSLGERMQLIANHARCLVWRDGAKWTVTRDQAKQYPEAQLDYRNLASDGESAISFSAHLPASFDGVELEYVDPALQAKKAYFRLDINSGVAVVGPSESPKKVKLMGCTTLAQASNRAYLEANRLIYQRTRVSDKVLSDGGSLGPGSLVRWVDPNDFYGDDGLQAGEVMGIAGLTISTSEPLQWNGQTSGRIAFTGASGERLGAPVACYPSGASVELESVPAGVFVADAVRQCGSRYIFATGLTNSEIESSGLYTVIEIKPEGVGVSSLALAVYDTRIYQGD